MPPPESADTPATAADTPATAADTPAGVRRHARHSRRCNSRCFDGENLMRTILGTLQRAAREYGRRFAERTVETGLTTPEILALRYVVENDDATVADMRSALAMSASTLSSLLARLERLGYVRRRSARRDRRSVEVVPTQVGRGVASIVTEIQLDLEADVRGLLLPGDFEAFVRIADAVAELEPAEIDPRDGLPLATA